ncbi:hypothetical protein BJX66DRAFT_335145 [Aspergillus keveii]|uniref:Uncharacterized protein n=1 Tax=Aspergillus keveii TaxID=714993 RepID=A0ABR4GDZ6_9EURO
MHLAIPLAVLTTLLPFLSSASPVSPATKAACTPGTYFCGIGDMILLCAFDGSSRLVTQCSGGCYIGDAGTPRCGHWPEEYPDLR